MRLQAFQVTDFRSIDDSGWINVSDVTALIGTNESGKTNLLVPLWKLNPAKEGAIDLLVDAPRKRYSEIRSAPDKVTFIRALFEPGEQLTSQLLALTSAPPAALEQVMVGRSFDGKHIIEFPSDTNVGQVPAPEVHSILDAARREIDTITPLKTEESTKAAVHTAIGTAEETIASRVMLDQQAIEGIKQILAGVDTTGAPKTGDVAPRYALLCSAMQQMLERVSRPAVVENKAARELVLKALPKFVYYANYGNLDSEIYLPHVIDNMKRTDLGAKEAAKARTLKVLFDFVKQSPQEIQQLGQQVQGRPPTEKEIAETTQKKKERDVLLQSASTDLTTKFREWWKQGTYRFRFQADGDHFRIWVSDDQRPEDIELEGRSAGLQWFLSFYLIFLVESHGAHEGAILLLDEPGLSLHPIAQRDLTAFFENLATTNQIIYTTHSPFLVDANHLDRVKAVYVKSDGTTGVSSDLRAGEKDLAQSRSIYPVHAALGLSVSDILFSGATPIIVEGFSDQHYLSAMKLILIGAGRIKPTLELLFVPAGGIRGVKALAGILSGRDDSLPTVLLDGDEPGRRLAADLKRDIYAAQPDRVLTLDTYCHESNPEIEDLIPQKTIVAAVSRLLRGPDEEFSEVVQDGKSIVPQIEDFARNHGITLAVPGWKVELAVAAKGRLLKQDRAGIPEPTLQIWTSVFQTLSR